MLSTSIITVGIIKALLPELEDYEKKRTAHLIYWSSTVPGIFLYPSSKHAY